MAHRPPSSRSQTSTWRVSRWARRHQKGRARTQSTVSEARTRSAISKARCAVSKARRLRLCACARNRRQVSARCPLSGASADTFCRPGPRAGARALCSAGRVRRRELRPGDAAHTLRTDAGPLAPSIRHPEHARPPPPPPPYLYSRLYAPRPPPPLPLIPLILGRCKLHPYHVHKPCPPRP